MNIMCDITQFVIVVLVPNETVATLGEHFMQHVLLKCVILDNDSPFKGVFTAICKVLYINYDTLAKQNHKGLLIKRMHRFINKAMNIAAEDRDTNDVL